MENNIEKTVDTAETIEEAANNEAVVETAELNQAETGEVVVESEELNEVTSDEAEAQTFDAAASLDTVTEKAKNIFGKVIDAFKVNPKKMAIICGSVLLAVIIVVSSLFIGINAATNNYKTPIKVMEKYANAKKYYSQTDLSLDLLNGFCEKENKKLYSLLEDSEDYEDSLEDAKDYFEDRIEALKDEYGNNYKYHYSIIDKEKLDKDELKEIRDTLRNRADSLENTIEETEDFDSDDWEEFADDMGFDGNKSKAKSAISILKSMRKKYKNAKVTAGYRLTVVEKITGSELDEPEEKEYEIVVFKVDGRWTTNNTSLAF